MSPDVTLSQIATGADICGCSNVLDLEPDAQLFLVPAADPDWVD